MLINSIILLQTCEKNKGIKYANKKTGILRFSNVENLTKMAINALTSDHLIIGPKHYINSMNDDGWPKKNTGWYHRRYVLFSHYVLELIKRSCYPAKMSNELYDSYIFHSINRGCAKQASLTPLPTLWHYFY